MAIGNVLARMNHPANDFRAWKFEYDRAEAMRKKAAVTGAEVFQDPFDPNMVAVIHRFPSLEAARAFLGDTALKEAMTKPA